MGVAVDQARRDPGAAERNDFLGAKAGELGALADADDLAVLNADRAIFDDAQRIARHGSMVAIRQSTSRRSHMGVALRRARC